MCCVPVGKSLWERSQPMPSSWLLPTLHQPAQWVHDQCTTCTCRHTCFRACTCVFPPQWEAGTRNLSASIASLWETRLLLFRNMEYGIPICTPDVLDVASCKISCKLYFAYHVLQICMHVVPSETIYSGVVPPTLDCFAVVWNGYVYMSNIYISWNPFSTISGAVQWIRRSTIWMPGRL